jgi:hypothetical protein
MKSAPTRKRASAEFGQGLDAKSDPLVAILVAVPFELFRVKLKTALVKGGLRRSEADRKGAAGRKP